MEILDYDMYVFPVLNGHERDMLTFCYDAMVVKG